MSDPSTRDRIARLTPEERAVLESRFVEQKLYAAGQTIPCLARDQVALPLSFAQERMWFLEQLNPGTPLYNVPWAVRLTGPLDVGALQRSLDALVERHSILRTTYHAMAGAPYQVVHESAPLPFHRVDLRGGRETDREVELQRLLSEEARRPFDLTSDCLLRATVAQLADRVHALILVAHHIAVDGWSHQILNRELAVLYESLRHGGMPTLPDLPIQYADYALWQRDEVRTSRVESELAYWRAKLERYSSTLDLPTSSPPTAEEAFSGGRVPISIPEHSAAGIRELARKLGVTPFMILAAAVMVTLHRYTGQLDIAIGTPIAGRTRAETEGLVGLFVNTLVLRGDLAGRPSFGELLRRVKDVCIEAYDHQEAPFERIVADLGAERIADRSPIVQIMVAYWGSPSEPLRLGGMEATPIDAGTDTSKFDLSFDFWEQPEGLTGKLTYSRQLFGEARMRDLAAHFVRLLEAGATEPERAIGEMPMLGAKERKKILVEWNAAAAPYPQETTIHRLFEKAAAAAPQSIAVVCGNDHLTYGDLNNRAAQLASYLRGLGVQVGELVGISMHRSTDLVVGLLGILKAGAAYLPLDPLFPPDRLRFIVEDAAIRVLLTQSSLAACLPTNGIQALRLDTDVPSIARLEPAPSVEIRPENLAYVMYTSGSTGQPKGVMVMHRNVVGFLNAFRCVTDAGPQRISTNVITYAFDTSVEEIFSPLCYGGTLHVVPYETTLDGRSLARYVLDHGINTTYIVPDLLPSVARTFEEHGGAGDLGCLITGLAPKKQRILQRLRDISPTLRILNAYGPTEVTYGATVYEFDFAADPERDVPIGRPFPDYQVYIVNEMLEPVPVGVAGEILIGGVGVSRGYLNRPNLTAERFIPNTFATAAEDRVFRTGDLGRYGDDGIIEFLGRNDRQVKIRGHRIELREIELMVETHPQVTACHASICTLAEDDVRLAAYVVWTGDRPGDESELRRHLQHQLPNYMIPSAFVFLDNLPLLPTGKIDQRALRQPEWGRTGSANQYLPPTCETEKRLVEIWEEVLKLDRVGIADSFFELGGHSLLAIRLINCIEEALHIRVPIRVLFDQPTIAEIASFIDNTATEEESV